MMDETRDKAPWGVLWLDDEQEPGSETKTWARNANIHLEYRRTIEGFVDVLGQWWCKKIHPAVVVLDIDLTNPAKADVDKDAHGDSEWIEEWATARREGRASPFRWPDDQGALDYVRRVAPGLELLLFGPPPQRADAEGAEANAKQLVGAVAQGEGPVSKDIQEKMEEWAREAHREDLAKRLEPKEFAQVVRAALARFRGEHWAWLEKSQMDHNAERRAATAAWRGGDFAAALLAALNGTSRPKILVTSAVWPTAALTVGQSVLDVEVVKKSAVEEKVPGRLAAWLHDALEGPSRLRSRLEDLVLELRRLVRFLPEAPAARGRALARELRRLDRPVPSLLRELGWVVAEEEGALLARVRPVWRGETQPVDSRHLGRALAYELIEAVRERARRGIDQQVVKKVARRIGRAAPPSTLARLRAFCGRDPNRADQLWGLAHPGSVTSLEEKRDAYLRSLGGPGEWSMVAASDAVASVLPWAPQAVRLIENLYDSWPGPIERPVLEAAGNREPRRGSPDAFVQLLKALGLERESVRGALGVPFPAFALLDVGPGNWIDAPFGLHRAAVDGLARHGDDARWRLYEHWLLRAIAGVHQKGVLGQHLGRAAAVVFGRELVERMRLNALAVVSGRSFVEPAIEPPPHEPDAWDPSSLIGRWVRWRGLAEWVHVEPNPLERRPLVDALSLLAWLERCWTFLHDAPTPEGRPSHVQVYWREDNAGPSALYVVSVGPPIRGGAPRDGDVGTKLRALLEALSSPDAPSSAGANGRNGGQGLEATASPIRVPHLGARALWLPGAGAAPDVLHDQRPLEERPSWPEGWKVPGEVLAPLAGNRATGYKGGRLAVVVGLPLDDE